MPRPISGNALSSTERTRRRRERQRQAEKERQAEAEAQRQAERERQQALTTRVKSQASAMLRGYATPSYTRDEVEREAWGRLLSYLDRWHGW